MKAQFFIISSVIMIYVIMLSFQYLTSFSDIRVSSIEEHPELSYIQKIKDNFIQTFNISNQTNNGDLNLISKDIDFTKNFLNEELLTRGIDFDSKFIFFSNGFETGSFSNWTNVYGTPQISSQTVYDGNYSLYSNGLGNVSEKMPGVGEVYARVYVNFKTLPANGYTHYFIGLYDHGSQILGLGVWNNSGSYNLRAYSLIGSGSYWSSNIIIGQGEWHYFELYWYENGTNSSVKARYDGNIEIDNETFNSQGKGKTIDEYRVGGVDTSGGSPDLYTDCVAIGSDYIGGDCYEDAKPYFVFNLKTNEMSSETEFSYSEGMITTPPSTTCNYPSSGNWIITNNVVCFDQLITINGNITIQNGGSLTLRNVTLGMNSTYSGQYGIEVQSGGGMYIYDKDNNKDTTNDASNITAVNKNYYFWFVVRHGSNFIMKNSFMSYYGWESCCVNGWTDYTGLVIQNDNAIIINNTLNNSMRGMILQSGSNILVSGNIIANGQNYGIILLNQNYYDQQNNTISNNVLINNGWIGMRIGDDARRNVITGNNITGGTYGLFIDSGDFPGVPVTYNNFSYNNITSATYGIYLNSSSFNNTFVNSSVSNSGVADYYFFNLSSTNTFRNMNWTSQRKIYFNDSISIFAYNDRNDIDLWLNTNVSAPSNITRKLVNWNNTLMQWNDTSSVSITARYNVSGLVSYLNYTVLNNSVAIPGSPFNSSSNGQISFAINLPANQELNITVVLPTYSLNSTNSTIAGTPIGFSLYWQSNIGLSNAITSLWNGSSWVNASSSCSLSGTSSWCNQTMVVNSTPQQLWWKQYANDSSNNWITSQNFSLITTSANWFSGWNYRKQHNITNATGADVNYTVQIIVVNGTSADSGNIVNITKARSDFGDIRFTNSTGSLLNYWMESVNNSVNATFWVKIDGNLTSTNQTIYVYYGNSTATNISNGTNTFLFYDAFANLNAWTQRSGAWTTDSNGLHSATGSDKQQMVTKSFTIANCRIRTYYKLSAVGSNIDAMALMARSADSNNLYGGIDYGDTTGANWDHEIIKYVGGSYGENVSGGWTSNTNWHTMEFDLFGSSLHSVIDGSNVADWTDTSLTGANPIGFYKGKVNNYFSAKWVFVSKYVSLEPAHGAWGPEEPSP